MTIVNESRSLTECPDTPTPPPSREPCINWLRINTIFIFCTYKIYTQESQTAVVKHSRHIPWNLLIAIISYFRENTIFFWFGWIRAGLGINVLVVRHPSWANCLYWLVNKYHHGSQRPVLCNAKHVLSSILLSIMPVYLMQSKLANRLLALVWTLTEAKTPNHRSVLLYGSETTIITKRHASKWNPQLGRSWSCSPSENDVDNFRHLRSYGPCWCKLCASAQNSVSCVCACKYTVKVRGYHIITFRNVVDDTTSSPHEDTW